MKKKNIIKNKKTKKPLCKRCRKKESFDKILCEKCYCIEWEKGYKKWKREYKDSEKRIQCWVVVSEKAGEFQVCDTRKNATQIKKQMQGFDIENIKIKKAVLIYDQITQNKITAGNDQKRT